MTLWMLLACALVTPEESDALRDPDGDGVLWPEDCDNADADIHPGAVERCDGVDQDCDGAIDEDAEDGASFYADADGDGFGDPLTAVVACAASEGAVTDSGDCDDGAPAVYPGADEVCGDGLVNDCDGATELDREQCSPVGDQDVRGAEARLLGEVDGDWAGYAVSGAGDLNGDGRMDLLIGARDVDSTQESVGAAYLVLSPVSGDQSLADAAAKLVGEADGADTGGKAGYNVGGAGDVNGDGYADVLVGAPYLGETESDFPGAVYLAFGPLTGEAQLSAADGRYSGGAWTGFGLSGVWDLNGDGQDEVFVGAPFTDSTGNAYLFLGPATGDLDVSEADASFLGAHPDASAGRSVDGQGDADGDGLGDLLIGALSDSEGGMRAGAAYYFSAWQAGMNLMSDADARMIGEVEGGEVGYDVAFAGDVNGDGLDDLLVGSPAYSSEDGQTGAVYLLFSPRSGLVELGEADARLVTSGGTDNLGHAVDAAGDVDGDGFADLLLGAPADRASTDLGTVYLAYGPTSGDYTLGADFDARWENKDSSDALGRGLAGVGDTDGDGRPDLLLGSYRQNESGVQAGLVYLILGEGY